MPTKVWLEGSEASTVQYEVAPSDSRLFGTFKSLVRHGLKTDISAMEATWA
jgi:hypothetical protein